MSAQRRLMILAAAATAGINAAIAGFGTDQSTEAPGPARTTWSGPFIDAWDPRADFAAGAVPRTNGVPPPPTNKPLALVAGR
jgi:hypothetical protein